LTKFIEIGTNTDAL